MAGKRLMMRDLTMEGKEGRAKLSIPIRSSKAEAKSCLERIILTSLKPRWFRLVAMGASSNHSKI